MYAMTNLKSLSMSWLYLVGPFWFLLITKANLLTKLMSKPLFISPPNMIFSLTSYFDLLWENKVREGGGDKWREGEGSRG